MTATYRLTTLPVAGAVTAWRGDRPLFTARGARLMRETRLPDSLYYPRAALADLALRPSERRSFCPFKGTARYWDVDLGDEVVPDAVWSYERALPESRDIEGMLGLMPQLSDRVTYEGAAPAPAIDGHIQGPLVDWITREASVIRDGDDLTRRLAERMAACGIAVRRLAVFIWSLHPEIAGVNYVWRHDSDEVLVRHGLHRNVDSPAFANSPIQHVSAGRGGVRQMLNDDEAEFEFSILDDLRAEGMTDYVAMPLHFSDGRINVLTMATDHPEGFTTANLGLVFECSSALARYYEVQTLRMNATALLDTYVGRRAGARVLGGEIRRGDGDDIEAAILFCDLVGSTRWAERLGRDAYLALLNGFFEVATGAARDHGGEVLKFIGDAVLAIFPVEGDPAAACAQAAACAAAIPAAIAASEALPDDLRVASGVSFGPVTYGNVGAPDRLDFTVIGRAATVAARLSDLAKAEGAEALVSAEIAAAAPDRARARGARSLHNIDPPLEVFALDRAAAAAPAPA